MFSICMLNFSFHFVCLETVLGGRMGSEKTCFKNLTHTITAVAGGHLLGTSVTLSAEGD